MNKAEIRSRFVEFVGAERLERFMVALHHKPTCRTRLFHWQEKLWEEFRERHQVGDLDHEQILDLFLYCPRHDRELEPDVTEEIRAYHDTRRGGGTYSLREAYRKVGARCFPFAAHDEISLDLSQPARSWHCPACCDELLRFRQKSHHAAMALADYDKFVCDMEEQALAIYERLGEDSEVGRLEGLGLYHVERRVTAEAADPALADLVALLDETARGLLCSADLLLDEEPLRPLREFVEDASGRTKGTEIDVEQNLKKLEALFDLEVKEKVDRSILTACRWLYFALSEIHGEMNRQTL